MKPRSLLVLGAAVLLPALAAAAIIYVDDDAPGDPGPGDPTVSDPLENGTAAHPYDAIQEGISAAVSGVDGVRVKDGTYTGAGNKELDYAGKSITVRSENGAGVCIIDCEGSGRAFLFNDSETSAAVVEGFTIRSGAASYGGGIACWMDSNPVIRHCTIEDCQVTDDGAGIDCWISSPTITECTITDNTADGKGGGINCDEADPEISDCTISWNESLEIDAPSFSGGGGIFCVASSPTVKRCTIRYNSAAHYGGGIDCCSASGPTVSWCTIEGNTSGNEGGGIASWSSSPTITDCLVADNDCSTTLSGDGGGGIFIWGGPAVVSRCLIGANESGDLGGGLTLTNCGANVEVSHCTIVANTADWDGGGIYCAVGSPTIFDCLIIGNTAVSGLGGGIECSAASDPAIGNCTLSANTAGTSGGGIDASGTSGFGSNPVIINCILWGDVPNEITDDAYSTPTVTYCDVQGGWPGPTNFSLDPEFASGPVHGFYLSHIAAGQAVNSPCIGAGSDTAGNLGLDERTTRTDGVPDAGTVDLGYHSAWPLAITDVYWDQATTSVVITFDSVAGVNYVVEFNEANAYADTAGWPNLTAVAGAGPSTTVTDNLSTNPLTHDFRFYRVRRADSSEWGHETAAVFELNLNVSFAVRQFFVSTPLDPDPDHDSVGDVLSTQLDYTGARIDKLTADSGLYSRVTYNPRIGWPGNAFSIVPGEGYWLNVGDAIPIPHKVRLTGYVPEDALSISVRRDSWAVTRRWMAYSMPRPTTLGGLGLPDAITPFWAPTNEVRMLPLGTTAWKRYFYDGTNWREGSIGGTLADSTPIVCGQGILFIHRGAPGQPDTLTFLKWYLHPPNTW